MFLLVEDWQNDFGDVKADMFCSECNEQIDPTSVVCESCGCEGHFLLEKWK